MSQDNPQPRFIKPFSKGQITLPKDYRDYLGISDQSWLFLSLQGDSLVMKPVEKIKIDSQDSPQIIKAQVSFEKYKKMLPKIKGAFGEQIAEENKQIRKEIEDRFKKYKF